MNITVPVEQSLITAILFGRIMIFFLIYIVIYWIEIFLLPPCMTRVLQKFWRIIRLIEYVSEEIEQLTEKLHLKFTSIVDSKLLQWTDSKVALVEFIYALYAGKCFSNGNTSLKDIAFCCETLFNIEIGDFYRIFLEIRNRKKSRTQFLDKLKEQIIKMMDELDR